MYTLVNGRFCCAKVNYSSDRVVCIKGHCCSFAYRYNSDVSKLSKTSFRFRGRMTSQSELWRRMAVVSCRKVKLVERYGRVQLSVSQSLFRSTGAESGRNRAAHRTGLAPRCGGSLLQSLSPQGMHSPSVCTTAWLPLLVLFIQKKILAALLFP